MSSKKDQERVHSKPVPRFYKMVSLILKEYCNRNCSLRTVMYEANVKNSDFKKYFATLSKIVSRYTAIESALRTVKLFEEQPRFDHHLAFVLASEMYTKDEDLVGNCKPISVLNSYGAKLRQVLKIAIEEQDKKKPNKESALNSRFVRINTLLCHETDVKKSLNALDWRFVEWDEGTSYDHFLQAVKNLGQWDYMKDFTARTCSSFPRSKNFGRLIVYNESHIILQDKASLLPAFISGVKPETP
ncbi:UNVERIFIED_CONTAM: hypothetical protein GTU68_026519 [Idotea baltica]|nr:hypothetical protein [Idotea baltica]